MVLRPQRDKLDFYPAIQEDMVSVSDEVSNARCGQGCLKDKIDLIDERLLDAFVNVKDFGARGDGETDDQEGINLAFSHVVNHGGTLYFPPGNYLISRSIGFYPLGSRPTTEVNFDIIGDSNAKISFIGNSSNFLFDIRFDLIGTIRINNLSLDGNDKVSSAIFISGGEGCELVTVENCKIKNLKGLNTPSITTSVNGILVSSNNTGICYVKNCNIENITREVNSSLSLSCSGISVTKFNSVVIENNYVKNVRTDTENKIDADGIKVFSGILSIDEEIFYNRDSVRISNNTIIDCEGRFIKLQTNGNCLVDSNLLKIESSIELIRNFVGIDSQVGNSSIINNTIYIGDSWTGGGSSQLCSLQDPPTVIKPYENFFQRFKNNNISLEKGFSYGVTTALPNSQVKIFYDISGNTISNYVSSTLTQAGNFALSSFVYSRVIYLPEEMNGEIVYNIVGNKVQSASFIKMYQPEKEGTYVNNNYSATVTLPNHGFSPGDVVHITANTGTLSYYNYTINTTTTNTFTVTTVVSGSTSGSAKITRTPDYTDKVTFIIKDNICYPNTYLISVFYGRGTLRTSSLLISNNSIGSSLSSFVSMRINAIKLLDGCDFYLTERTNSENLPSSGFTGRISKSGYCYLAVQNNSNFWICRRPVDGWNKVQIITP